MSDSVLERTRLLHEDIERQQDQMAEELLFVPKSNKQRILQEHRLKERLDIITRTGKDLLEMYEDADESRKDELEAIAGANVISTFYDRLKHIKEYYRKFPAAGVKIKDTMDLKPKVKFSGEERFGKNLDMHTLHDRYCNLRVFKRLDYVDYLNKFHLLHTVASKSKLSTKTGKDYVAYVEELLAYLKSFYARTHPLCKLATIDAMIAEDFEKQWAAKTLPGWFGELAADTDSIAATSSADAAAAGNDPLYCAACDKRFAKVVSFKGHLNGKKHKRAVKRLEAAKEESGDGSHTAKGKSIALTETLVTNYVALLQETIEATSSFIQRKQTQTYDLIAAELEEESEEDESSSEEEDDKPIYNPLNLPLGWDGKPIPFWLYKLHGLNIEKKCEICGDYSYWGPRAFDRHFKEWRHVYGLRCLGIPNTPHFHNITNIADATALHKKLELEGGGGWQAEDEEEFEDGEGNVFNKKTYEDLKRQGLI